MNESQLYIAGVKIDIDEDQVIALTKQIAEIAQIENKQANLSNTFRTWDKKALAFVSEPGSQTKHPYRFLPARLVQNGFEIIRNGNAVIKSAGERDVKITIYWGNNDFFDRLNFKLSELDLSALNHIYDKDGAIAQTDIFYPFIEYGENSVYQFTDTSIYMVQDISLSYPAVYIRRVWDEIFSKIGFTYSMTNNTVFNRQAMQLTTRNADIVDKEPYLVSSQNTTDGSGTFFRFLHDNIIVGNDLYFPRSGVANATALFINATGFRAVFRFRLNMNMDFEKGNEDSNLKFAIYTNKSIDGNSFQTVLYSTLFTESFYGQQTIEFDLDLDTLHSLTDLSVNGFFEMRFQVEPLTTNPSEITIRPGSTFQLYDFDLPEIEIGDDYDVSRNMPDITAYNFIQNIARQFGMIFNTNNRHVDIITFDDVVRSKTDKRVFQLIPEVDSIVKEFNPGSYFQNNIVTYTEGVNVSDSFVIDNKTLNTTGEIIKIEFYLPGFVTKTELGEIMTIPINTEDIKTPPMFLDVSSVVDTEELEIIPAYSNSQDATDKTIPAIFHRAKTFESVGRRGGLIRGVSATAIIRNSYGSLTDILDDFVKFKMFVRMNEQQFFGLELYKAYYVPLLRTYAYIEKVNNFVKGRPVEITMIKI